MPSQLTAKWYQWPASQEVPLAGNDGNPEAGLTFSQYQIFEESKRFIRENKDRPFFAYLCWTPPHGQWGMPTDDPSWLKYKDKPWTRNAKMYAAMVNLVDREVSVGSFSSDRMSCRSSAFTPISAMPSCRWATILPSRVGGVS